MPQHVIGIFLGDEKTRYGSLIDDIDNGIVPPDVTPDNFQHGAFENNGMKLAEAIKTAIDRALKFRGNSNHQICLSIAAPGPIRNSGSRRISSLDYGLTREDIKTRERFHNADLLRVSHEIMSASLEGFSEGQIVINHDAAAHALGEYHLRQPSTKNYNADWTHAHVIVKHGVGGALIHDGKIVQGRMHSELGHIHVVRHEDDNDIVLRECSAHSWQDCLESMTCRRSLEDRWGKAEVKNLPIWKKGDERLSIIASYFGQLCNVLTLVLAPKHIVFSGFPFENPHLIQKVRQWSMVFASNDETKSSYPGYDEQDDDHFIECSDQSKAPVLGTCLLGLNYQRRGSVERLNRWAN